MATSQTLTIKTPQPGADFMTRTADQIASIWSETTHFLTSVGGTATAFTATQLVPPAALADGMKFWFVPSIDSGAAPTLKINAFAAIAFQVNGAALTAGQMKAGRLYVLRYLGGVFVVISGLAGPNADITSLPNLSTAITIAQGGTGATNAGDARAALGLTITATLAVGTGLASAAGSLSVSYGTTAGTAAAGNDGRITGALQSSNLLAAIQALPPASLITLLTAIIQALPTTASPGSGTLVNNGGVPTIA